MQMKGPGFVPYEMKTNIIKITGYRDKNPQGTLENPYFGGEVEFKSLMELLILIEDMQDNLNFPQQSMEKRKFQDGIKADGKNLKLKEPPKEVLASFKLNIYFRQNASWQGNIIWLETQQEAQFRSVLEMIFIIDGALLNK